MSPELHKAGGRGHTGKVGLCLLAMHLLYLLPRLGGMHHMHHMHHCVSCMASGERVASQRGTTHLFAVLTGSLLPAEPGAA